jgi:hypothetical protein
MYALGMQAASQISTYTKYPMPPRHFKLIDNELVVSEPNVSGGRRIKAERVLIREPSAN